MRACDTYSMRANLPHMPQEFERCTSSAAPPRQVAQEQASAVSNSMHTRRYQSGARKVRSCGWLCAQGATRTCDRERESARAARVLVHALSTVPADTSMLTCCVTQTRRSVTAVASTPACTAKHHRGNASVSALRPHDTMSQEIETVRDCSTK